MLSQSAVLAVPDFNVWPLWLSSTFPVVPLVIVYVPNAGHEATLFTAVISQPGHKPLVRAPKVSVRRCEQTADRQSLFLR